MRSMAVLDGYVGKYKSLMAELKCEQAMFDFIPTL